MPFVPGTLNWMTPPVNATVLVVGAAEHGEFATAMATLRAAAGVTTVASVPAALVAVQQSGAPHAIVFAQRRPGEIPASGVAQLRRHVPHATAVALLGSWCEGETRTGRPWPGVPRCYWYEFPGWWERFVRARQVPPQAAHRSGLVVVDSNSRAMFEAIATTLADDGHSAVWQPRGRPPVMAVNPAAGIWEGGQLVEPEIPPLAHFIRGLPPQSRKIVLLDFPRCDTVAYARGLGVDAVLGKPWHAEDLCGAVQVAPEDVARWSHPTAA